MELRIRALMVVGLVLGSTITVLYAVCFWVIYTQRSALERIEASQHLHRVELALKDRQSLFHQSVVDYARWDDTWNYLVGDYPEYTTEVLDTTTLTTMNAEAMSVARFDGAISVEIDPEAVVGDDLWARWRALLGTQSRSAWVVEGDTVWLISSAPVQHNDGSGPSYGSILSARRCDPAFEGQIGALTGTVVRISPVSAAPPAHLAQTGTLSVSTQLPAFYEDLQLRAQAPHPLAALTQTTYRTLTLAILVGGSALTLLIMWGLDQKILAPIARLRQEILALQQRA